MIEALVRRSQFNGRITHVITYDSLGISHVANRSGLLEDRVKCMLADGHVVMTKFGHWCVEPVQEEQLT